MRRLKKFIPIKRDIAERIAVAKHLFPNVEDPTKLSGIKITEFKGQITKETIIKGIPHGLSTHLNGDMSVCCMWNGEMNGYWFYKNEFGYGLTIVDMGEEIHLTTWDENGHIKNVDSLSITREHLELDAFLSKYPEAVAQIEKTAKGPLWSSLIEVAYIDSGVSMEMGKRLTWAYERKLRFEQGLYTPNSDFLPFYLQQMEMTQKIILEDRLAHELKYIGGVSVAFSQREMKLVGAIIVLDLETFEVVDKAYHEENITYPYIPHLYSFREVPPLLEAMKKLKVTPDLLLCEGHGIDHPIKMGIATHLGMALDMPTIACSTSRLVGLWEKEKLGLERGSEVDLKWEGKRHGKVLRTQNEARPVFVSIGHKTTFKIAMDLVLKLSQKSSLPLTIEKTNELLDTLLEERTEVLFLDRDED
ncbi:MAG: endonuclease V [Bacteroidota bacterium]